MLQIGMHFGCAGGLGCSFDGRDQSEVELGIAFPSLEFRKIQSIENAGAFAVTQLH